MESNIFGSDLFESSRSYFGYGSYKLDCNAALAILGILGLIEILRDLVQDVTTPTTGRKISVDSMWGGSPLSILQSLRNELPRDLEDLFPGIILPFLHSLVDINDDILPPSCLEVSFCKANYALVYPSGNFTSSYSTTEKTFGLKKNIRWKIAKDLSDVLANSFVKFNENHLAKALEAAEVGRQGKSCDITYPECQLKAPYKPEPHFRMTYLQKSL